MDQNNQNEFVLRFVKENAPPGHNGTILAGAVLPKSYTAPFSTAWGYLEGQSMMEAHAHPTHEIYTVFKGRGFCRIDDRRFPIAPGDVITIPPGATHTMECEDGESLLWAAFWWMA